MPVIFSRRLRGWRFVLFNLTIGIGHAIVLFGAGAYIALLPHVAGDLGGILPSFGTWAQTDFMIALALAFHVARWLGCRVGEYRLFIVAFVATRWHLTSVRSARVWKPFYRHDFCSAYRAV
jgi:DHA2 family multidrug resistance protein